MNDDARRRHLRSFQQFLVVLLLLPVWMAAISVVAMLIVVVGILAAAHARAAERAPALSIEAARALVSSAGINRGTTFAVGQDRYAVGGVTIERHGAEFTVRITIVPLEKYQ